MTWASKISLVRLLLIPVFVLFAVSYSESINRGAEDIRLRFFALAVFAVASLTDALDGYVARRFNQCSRLGRILDPAADKLLVLTALVTLSVTNWHAGLPLWFGVLVITRDIVIVTGVLVIRSITGRLLVQPSMTGKICTFLQLCCVCWVLLDFWSVEARHPILDILIWSAGGFTVLSGWRYVVSGYRQARSPDQTSQLPDAQ